MVRTMLKKTKEDMLIELNAAITTGVVRNTLYQECKYYFGGISKDRDAIAEAIFNKEEKESPFGRTGKGLDDLYYAIPYDLYQLPSFIKKYNKAYDKGDVTDELKMIVQPYVAKWMPYVEALKLAKPLIVKGREPKPAYVGPTKDQFCSICYCCGKKVVVNKKGRLVHHGFQISGGYGHYFGQREGSCGATDMKPWEESKDQGIFIEIKLQQNIAYQSNRLEALREGTAIIFLEDRAHTKIEPGYEKYQVYADRKINETLRNLEFLKSSLNQTQRDLSTWKAKKLIVEKVPAK